MKQIRIRKGSRKPSFGSDMGFLASQYAGRYLALFILVICLVIVSLGEAAQSALRGQIHVRHVLVQGRYECEEDEYLRLVDKRPGPDVWRCAHIDSL